MMPELELAPVIETKFNRLPWCQRASPSTTLYESVKSTDADRLMQTTVAVKNYFPASWSSISTRRDKSAFGGENQALFAGKGEQVYPTQ
jgi:hypothetical protein